MLSLLPTGENEKHIDAAREKLGNFTLVHSNLAHVGFKLARREGVWSAEGGGSVSDGLRNRFDTWNYYLLQK